MKREIKAFGRKGFAKKVRVFGDMTIFFEAKDTIYIKDSKYPNILIANRWFVPKGFYRYNWAPFQLWLKRAEITDIFRVIEEANRYEIGIVACNSMPKEAFSENVEII